MTLKPHDSDDCFKLIDCNDEQLKFLINGPAQKANELRQFLLSGIPCMAISKVMIIENTTIMTDDILKLRIGSLPILADKDDFDDHETFELSIDFEGQSNIRTMYSNALQGEYKCVYDNIPIVYLNPGQKVKATLIVSKNTGNKHIRWTTCSVKYKMIEKNSFQFIVEPNSIYSSKRMLEIVSEYLQGSCKQPS